ncbi:chitinase [Longispora fulva]|uniref:chitinase n=1 Tax=Longispora fulva TaxID=619741 RepID=A0A8J7GBH1_9ACTN|nr:glycosyl hydrolase family 18 protein [Longispora fulva]MBG6134396.1 chitinase [Longispora fulva]GIG62687.1 chitinase [Longispora fulva]
MRRTIILTAVLAAAAAVGLALPALADASAVANPGFETGTLSPWTCDPTASVVTGHARSGSYALAGATTNSSTAECRQTVAVAANTDYRLSAQVNGSYVYLGVVGGTSTWTPGTSGGYSQLSVSFNSGSATSVTVYLHGWYAQGTYYADDVALDGPGGTPSPTGSPTASPTTSPTSSPSPSPSPTTSPSDPGPLPRHALTGYWQNFTNGAKALRLSDVPTSYDLIAVAFADTDPNSSGGVTFTLDSGLSNALGGYTDANFTNDVATLHGRGQHVVLSVGGQNGTVKVADSTAATNFATSVSAVIKRYGFDGVDIDLENGLNATYMAQALRSIRSSVGSGLIITMAPQTIDMQSTGNEYFTLALNIKDILTVVHTQFYNSGSMLGCDNNAAYSQGTENFLTALACIQLQSALRPDQVALGLPASSSAAGGGYTDPATINDAVDCLAQGTHCGTFRPPSTWPALRGVMTWSVNWDASNNYAFANTVKPHLKNLP